jgi:hypothetical protein
VTDSVPPDEQVSLLDRKLPSWAELRLFAIAPGNTRAYDPAEWLNALVVVERGAIELVELCGRRWRFDRGAILYLADLPVRALCSVGSEVALLSCLTRKSHVPAR